jgi:hypothetical protein
MIKSTPPHACSLPAEFGGLNAPSLALDDELAHYASFDATIACLITTHYESESLGPLYGIIRHELQNVATSALIWAVKLRASYATVSRTGRFSYADLAVLATILDQDLPDYVGLDVEFVPSHATSPTAMAPCMICLQVPTLYALTRPSDTKGTSSAAFFSISWPFVVLHPRIICVLFLEPAVGLWNRHVFCFA